MENVIRAASSCAVYISYSTISEEKKIGENGIKWNRTVRSGGRNILSIQYKMQFTLSVSQSLSCRSKCVCVLEWLERASENVAKHSFNDVIKLLSNQRTACKLTLAILIYTEKKLLLSIFSVLLLLFRTFSCSLSRSFNTKKKHNTHIQIVSFSSCIYYFLVVVCYCVCRRVFRFIYIAVLAVIVWARWLSRAACLSNLCRDTDDFVWTYWIIRWNAAIRNVCTLQILSSTIHVKVHIWFGWRARICHRTRSVFSDFECVLYYTQYTCAYVCICTYKYAIATPR